MIATPVLYIILGVIFLTAFVVSALVIIERNKNYFGDSSLIPGCLFWAVILLMAIIFVAHHYGKITL